MKLTSDIKEIIHKHKKVYATNDDNITVKLLQINNNKPVLTIHGEGPHRSKLCFVKKDFFKFILNNNPWTVKNKRLLFDNYIYETKDLSINLIEELIENKMYIYLYNKGHQIFDHSFNLISSVRTIKFSSINFRLERLLNHLNNIDKCFILNHKLDKNELIVQIIINSEVLNLQYQRMKHISAWATKIMDIVKYENITKENDFLNIIQFKR